MPSRLTGSTTAIGGAAAHGMCDDCQALPQGPGGHAGMFLVELRSAKDPVFECAQCRTLWRRHYLGGGTFTWHVERLRAKRGRGARQGGLGAPRLRKVLAFIASNVTGRPTLADMASVASVSVFHFARGFKQDVGMSPHQFLLKARLSNAQHLLATSDLPLAAVSEQVGFGSQGRLSQSFKAAFGITPREYRRTVRGVPAKRGSSTRDAPRTR